MKKIRIILPLLFASLTIYTMAQQTPAPAQSASILITGVTIHVGNGQVLDNGAVGFDNGKITYVGTMASANSTSYMKVVDGKGQHLYPGFIALNTSLGLAEIDAVRASLDVDDIGEMIPHVRSLIAYNAESLVVESMRPNGILIAQIAPQGGTLSGSSSIVQLDAWNWEDAAIKADDGLHLHWPEAFTRGRWWLGEEPGLKPNKKYDEQVQQIAEFFGQANTYLSSSQPRKNLAFEAMKGLSEGDKRLFIHANREKEIVDAVNWALLTGIKKVVLVEGTESAKVAELLASKNIPVIVSHPHRLPEDEDSDVKEAFRLAYELISRGVLASIDVSGRMERMNTRNLPFYAGSFAAYGVNPEKALQMITLDAAKILGIEDRLGSIEVGKDATFFLSEGDALDMRSNILHHAFISGREISLETHQTKLWRRYAEKYEQD